jgi:exosortase/archaeosortase family protein
MDTALSRTSAGKFALRLLAWSLAFFGLLRLNWTEAHMLLPFTRVQGRLAAGLVGTPTLPVELTLACSGADALALCLGAVLAYPVSWRMRLAGAFGGAGLVFCLNTVRIGTLGRVAGSPAWFNALHVYLWPGVLALGIAGYVLAWMRIADRRQLLDEQRLAPHQPVLTGHLKPTRQFVALTGVFLVLFIAASPLYLQSAGVLSVAGLIASAAAAILGVFGVSAHASSNVLWTARGGFLVTQECISTPLIPVYLAAICVHAATWRRLIAGVFATVPLFIALGIVRLLVVALPDTVVASPLFLVHAFYQLLLAAVIVILAALWRHGGRGALVHALAGVSVGVLFVYFLGPLYTRIVAYPVGVPLDDPQDAISMLPAFQLGLFGAVWIAAFMAVGWRRFVAGLAVLGLTQTVGLLALHVLAHHSGMTAHVRDIRGWAVAGPLLALAAVVNGAWSRR